MEEKNRLAPAEERLQDRFEELQQRATKDALSGLLNRATMEQYIRDRLRTMGREDSCALFIVDLDNFKQVNDTFGHPAGDQAIRKTGQILSGIFRASDIVGRLGGDEFAAFLCGRVTDEMVRQRAADICAQLHIVLGDREIIHLTASVGVYLAGRGQEFEGLYQTADLALYKAKKAGKHRFCLKSREGYQESGREAFRPVNAISLGGLLEQMGSGVALLEMGDPPQVIYVSPSYCRIADLDAGAFPLPKALSELIHPDDLPPLEEALRQGLRQGSAVEHTHRISMDGGRTWRWWYIRAIQVEYNTKAPVMLVTAVDISGFKETERRQAQQIRRLQTALGQTSKRLWEVDLPAGAFRAYTRDGTFRPLGKGETAFPDDLIEGGWIHPGSVARFRDFAQELLGGRAQGFGNFAVRIGDAGCYSWASVSYRTLFDEAGRAVQAVGVLEELPQGLTGRDGWAPDQAQLPERLAADLIVRMRADLDLDTVETLWMEGSDLTGQVRETRCSQVLQLERQKIFCPGEQQEFPAHFDREELLRLFRAGRHWLCAEYRRTDGGGSIRWVRHVLYLAEGPADRHVRLFVYLIRLDPGRLLEPAIHRESRRDPVTRLFDRDSIRGIAEDLFSDRKNGNRAVAVLQVHGLPQSSPGTDAQTEQLRYAIAAALALTLGGSCVLGQHSPDRTVIVFPSVTEKEDLHRSLEEAVAFVRRMLAGEPDGGALRFIMGVQLVPAAAAVYSDMLAQAVRVCDFWWNAAADTVAFAPEDADWDWTQLPRPDREDRVSVIRAAELERPLSEREKDVALDCVSGMLTARTLDASLRGVLQTIGAYYRADRVYTLMLTEERRTVVMTFEWTSARKRSIQQAVSGTRLERFPLLRRCMSEQAPVFLSRQAPIDLDGESEETAPWYFAAVPLIRDQQTEGFLCIENAREHPEDAALFSTLIPFTLQQRERFGRAERSAGAAEQLMDLPDLRAYTQALCTLTSEHYSSLGAVCLDIPDFAAISSGLGSEYGSRMLWYVAGTLTDLFGGALLFRTWESQFIAFYPNTTREVFLGRCGRLRSILQRRYPKQVRIGRAWAEGVFSGKRLAEAARAAMRAGRAGDPGGELFPIRQEDASPVAEATRSGRFVVHYQPKIDMRTGALTGAEALVRAVAEDGSVVPPSRFIELLEEDGTIRDLDLFVLEQALSQAEQWRAEGLYVVPLAVNISRATLVHPSTLASVLAIQSRYPQLPPETLELEITERGNIDAAGFRQLAGGASPQTPMVIGIGASAGGLEALQQFFGCMPPNSGLSFVVVQHLSPDYKSLMADILGKHTEMAVCQAENHMAIEPDTVYLIPPKKYMTVRDGQLILSDAPGTLNHPIDAFFASLAEEKREHAIAVVLSGTGSDGTNGVKAVKEVGGLVIAQDPDSAKFDGMPRSVINTGLADFVLSPEEIAEEILNFSNTPLLLRPLRSDGLLCEDESLFSEEETLSHIYTILKNASGIDFTYYKRSTILRRIERRMLVTHTATLSDFARLLGDSPEEVNILTREIFIGVTSFFRDPAFFEKLKYNAIYKIVERTREDEPIRVWSAGCSTGEEAYSIAILFQEVMEELQVQRDVKIFATDVDSRAIEQAGKGVFSENIIDDVTPDRLAKFFMKQNDQYHISKSVRRMIVFATHNMFSDPPFGKLDLISCRNVMIYFQPVMRRGLFAIFHSALKNGGFLFLGKSETAGEYVSLFKPVCSAEKIYLHKAEGKVEDLAPPTFNIPNVQNIALKNIHAGMSQSDDTTEESRYTRFLEHHLPASVVIGEDDTVLHFFGDYNQYLTLAPGRASLNFFSMLCKDLSLVAATAISRCRTEHTAVTYTDIAVDTPSGRKVIDLTVEPIPGQEGENELAAVLFLDRSADRPGGVVEKYDLDATAARRISDLEREFQVSQRDLRSTIQRLETVNGELQAANEELLTANEELQSSTEELQSVNEELYTVNTEHQLKLDELTTMTNDLSNFLSSTMIGILFVDGDLNIRKFTEYVGREFQLMEHDVGRNIQIFAHSFPEEAIEADCRTVLRDLVSIDREVTAMNGRCYTLRIAPYRTTENSIRGLVITIIDSLGTVREPRSAAEAPPAPAAK